MDEYKDLMTLLAMTVLVDSKVAECEVDIFSKAVSRIKISHLELPLPSERAALAWFKEKHIYLRSIANKPRADFDVWLDILLKRIEKQAEAGAIVHVMEMIAIADDEKCEQETQFIEQLKA